MTPKQEQFCLEYMIDFNATQAAIRAGYSKKTGFRIGAENMQKPAIVAKIAELRAELQHRTQVTADRVIEELARIGFARIDQVVKCTGRAVTIKNFSKLPPEVLAAVESVQKTKDGIKVRFHNKEGALEQLGRHFGIFEKDNAQQAQLVLIAPVVRLDGDGAEKPGCDAEQAADGGLEGPGGPQGS